MSSAAEVIDSTAVELVTAEPAAAITLWRTNDPSEVVAAAAQTAGVLADVVRQQNLVTAISGREHVRVEGWTLLGSMLGVFPVCEWTRKLENGWEARVVAKTRDGATVGAAEAECLRTEKTWAKRDDYALRSMAQTRATSKALRQPLGFVMTLAGFDPTPLEEMPATGEPAQSDTSDEPIASQKAEPAGPVATDAQTQELRHLLLSLSYTPGSIEKYLDAHRTETGVLTAALVDEKIAAVKAQVAAQEAVA